MKKVVIFALLVVAFYMFYYGPKQFREDCVIDGGEFNAQEGICKIDFEFTLTKEELEKQLSDN